MSANNTDSAELNNYSSQMRTYIDSSIGNYNSLLYLATDDHENQEIQNELIKELLDLGFQSGEYNTQIDQSLGRTDSWLEMHYSSINEILKVYLKCDYGSFQKNINQCSQKIHNMGNQLYQKVNAIYKNTSSSLKISDSSFVEEWKRRWSLIIIDLVMPFDSIVASIVLLILINKL